MHILESAITRGQCTMTDREELIARAEAAEKKLADVIALDTKAFENWQKERESLNDNIEGLRRELFVLQERYTDLEETQKAWWDLRTLGEDQMLPVFNDAIGGYLRTCRVGGMSTKDSDMVKANVEHFAELYLVSTLWPFIRQLAEKIATK